MSRSSHPRHPVNYSGGRWYGNLSAAMSQQAPSLGAARRKRGEFRSRRRRDSDWWEHYCNRSRADWLRGRSSWRLRLALDDDDDGA